MTDVQQRKIERGVVHILFTRRAAAAGKSRPEARELTFLKGFSQMHASTLDAVRAFAQMNQRVLGELIELSSSVAKGSLGACAALQSAAIAATVTTVVATLGPWESLGERWRHPFAWYRKTLLHAPHPVSTPLRPLGL